MIDDVVFKEAVLKIIINNFGIATAKTFEPMFLNKSRLEIIASLEQLLTAFIGKDAADKQLGSLPK